MLTVCKSCFRSSDETWGRGPGVRCGQSTDLWLKRQHFMFLQFWRLDIRGQGPARSMQMAAFLLGPQVAIPAVCGG